jgi:hypothetical protein
MNEEIFDALESAEDFRIGLTHQPHNGHGFTFQRTDEHASKSTNQGMPMIYTANELLGYDSDDESIESIDAFDLALLNDAPEQDSEETPLILDDFGSKSMPSILQVRLRDGGFNASTSSLQERYPRSNFQEPSRKQTPMMDDSPLQAFLRRSKSGQDALSGTQHTKTTLESTQAHDSDDESITLTDVFESHDFAFEDPAGSSSSLSGGPFDGDKSGGSESFHDSVSSLNSAFEQLSACMERTARSRRMVTHFSKRQKESSKQRGLTRLGSQRSLSSSGSFSSSGQPNKRKSQTHHHVTHIRASTPVKARKTCSKPKRSLLK